MEPLKYKWNDSERSISYEPDDLCIDPTKLDEAQNEGVAIARSYEVQPNDVENLKLIRELQNGTSSPRTTAVEHRPGEASAAALRSPSPGGGPAAAPPFRGFYRLVYYLKLIWISLTRQSRNYVCIAQALIQSAA
ncbi:hypothetical protein quinque_012872 [Culex quinquefasciatus]